MKYMLSALVSILLINIPSNASALNINFKDYFNLSNFQNTNYYNSLYFKNFERKGVKEVAISFKDENFEKAIRDSLNKPLGDIYPSDMETIETLSAPNKDIYDISGIEYAINLRSLNLQNNSVKDIEPLKTLDNLSEVFLNTNDIYDITPIKDLNSLNKITLSYNFIDFYKDENKEILNILKSKNIEVETYNNKYITNEYKSDTTLLIGEKISKILKTNLFGSSSDKNWVLNKYHVYDIENQEIIGLNEEGELVALKEGSTNVNISYKGYNDDIFNFSTTIHVLQEDDIINIPNKDFEKVIRETSGKPLGNIYKSEMERIKEIKLDSCDIKDKSYSVIEGIQSAKNLSSFSYFGNCSPGVKLSDISALSELTNLEHLDLYFNDIEDLSPIKNLNKINYLNIEYNEVSDLSPLENLTELKQVILGRNRITDISVLKNLTKLDKVLLGANYIRNIEILNQLPNLKTVNVDYNFLDTSSNSESRKTIENLKSNGVNVSYSSQYQLKMKYGTDTTILVGEKIPYMLAKHEGSTTFNWIPSLDHVYTIEDEEVATLDSEGNIIGLKEGFTRINISLMGDKDEYFNFSHNLYVMNTDEVVDIPDTKFNKFIRNTVGKPLGNVYKSEMERILELNVSPYNDVEIDTQYGLEGLQYAKNLRKFTYNSSSSRYQLSDLSIFSNMDSLEELNLISNNINDLSDLENNKNLNILNLSSNNVNDLSALQNNRNLITLNLSNNSLTSLPLLDSLSNLTNLDVSYNYIDISQNSKDREFINSLLNKGINVNWDRQYSLKNNTSLDFLVTEGKSFNLDVSRCELSSSGSLSSCSTVPQEDLEYTLSDDVLLLEDGFLVANREGVTNLQVHYKDLRGGRATLNYTVTVDPYVYKPTINYSENGFVSIEDNGNNVFLEEDVIIESFDNLDNLKFEFSNPNWNVSNGVMKSEQIGHSSETENTFTILAKENQKLIIKLRVSSESADRGYIYLNSKSVYNKSGNNPNFDVVELDLVEGENTITFKYKKDGSVNSYDDAMIIDEIKTFVKKPVPTDVIEYRINNGSWKTYTKPFMLSISENSTTKIEAKTIVERNVYESSIAEKIVEPILAEDLAEKAVEKAEESKDPIDIEEARDLVNDLLESTIKDDLQGRLDSISPNIEFEVKNATANLDIYIKSKNMLSLSLNTNNITFEDFSGIQDEEKLNALTLTIKSSLPYDLKAYLSSEIIGSKYGEEMDKSIFNIRANGKDEYQTFKDIENPLTLLDNQVEGNGINHGIDLMLKGDLAHKKDVYKATIKFEVEQK